MKPRPKVGKVGMHLGKKRGTGLGSCHLATISGVSHLRPEEPKSDTMEYREFEVFLLALFAGQRDRQIFPMSSSAVLASPTESQATSGPFNGPSTPSTQYSELSQEMAQVAVVFGRSRI